MPFYGGLLLYSAVCFCHTLYTFVLRLDADFAGKPVCCCRFSVDICRLFFLKMAILLAFPVNDL